MPPKAYFVQTLNILIFKSQRWFFVLLHPLVCLSYVATPYTKVIVLVRSILFTSASRHIAMSVLLSEFDKTGQA